MATITIFAIASAIILLLLIQTVTVRLVLSNGYRITVDYSLFTLTLKSGGAPRKKKRKKLISSIRALTRLAGRIIASSKITVHQLNKLTSDADTFLDIALQTRLYNIVFSGIILLYEEIKRRIIGYVRKSYQ